VEPAEPAAEQIGGRLQQPRLWHVRAERDHTTSRSHPLVPEDLQEAAHCLFGIPVGEALFSVDERFAVGVSGQGLDDELAEGRIHMRRVHDVVLI
jgi:hypothetical protein